MIIRSITPTISVWIGGSFLSDKVNPNDIDVVYWFHDATFNLRLNSASETEQMVITKIGMNEVEGLPVDAYFAFWHLDPSVDNSLSHESSSYLGKRGYWDDFWMRFRSGEKDDPAVITDALPRRGYIEVVLDGFHGF